MTPRCFRYCCTTCACLGSALDGHEPGPTPWPGTRPIPRAIRTHLRERGIGACIPEPDDQKGHRKRQGSRGGRPPAFDAQRYRGRNVVERAFNEDKQWHSLATRYDKLAVVYRAGAVLRAVTVWLKRLGDMP